MESIPLTLTQKDCDGVHHVDGRPLGVLRVRKLICLCGCRDNHKTQSMIVEVVHGGFGGAMARFRKAGGEAEKREEQHEKS